MHRTVDPAILCFGTPVVAVQLPQSTRLRRLPYPKKGEPTPC